MTAQQAIDDAVATAERLGIDAEVAEDSVQYYLDEGYPPELAAEFAGNDLSIHKEVGDGSSDA